MFALVMLVLWLVLWLLWLVVFVRLVVHVAAWSWLLWQRALKANMEGNERL